MLLRKTLFIVLSVCFCTLDLVAMNGVAEKLLKDLHSVAPNEVGAMLGRFIDARNDKGCKLDDQAISLSTYLRLSRHFGNHPSILRDFGGGVKEEMIRTAHTNSSLFNVNVDQVSADIADSVTREIFDLLFKTEKASFFVPEATTGGNRIILKTKLEGHTIALLKEYAGLYSPDQDDDTVEKIPTNIFEICVRVQKQFNLPDGTLVTHVGSKAHPHAQTIVISIYPDNPLDPNGSALPPISK